MSAGALLVGCSTRPSDDGGETGAGATSTGPASTEDGEPPPGGSTSTGMPSDTTGAPPPPDTTTGTPDDTGPPPVWFDLSVPDAPKFEFGCTKVDFLFVVDNSGSMGAQQTQLLASFNGFITAIQASLEETVDSYHVGVITSDNYSGNAPGCTTIGDLVTQTSGFNALGQVCTPFAEGNRFATDQDDLMVKFPCMAQVGTSGSPIEQPVTATIAALDPSNGGPGACNEDFLRDDAILVIVIVTDDPPLTFDMDDAHPATNTSTWYDDVIAAKNDDPEALVVIGFVPWMNTGCVYSGLESPNLINFITAFGDQGVLASVCEPDYGPVFADTVATIVTTCENFEPPN